MAHADKSFLLRHNNSDLLDVTPVATLRERVYQVFGSQMLEDLLDLGDQSRSFPLPVEDEQAGPRRFRLRGFVSGPQVQRLNRNSIYLFVNGRLIRDRLLLHALSAAYHNLMPPACYPFALLFLDCDLEEVDVNVHPSKTEVRFRHGSLAHDFVRDTVRAYELLSMRAKSGSVYNLASGRAVSLAAIVERLRSLSTVAFEIQEDAERMRSVDVALMVGSAEAMARDLGWRAEIQLDDTLRWTLDDWRRRVRVG